MYRFNKGCVGIVTRGGNILWVIFPLEEANLDKKPSRGSFERLAGALNIDPQIDVHLTVTNRNRVLAKEAVSSNSSYSSKWLPQEEDNRLLEI